MRAEFEAIAFDGDDTLWHNERLFTVTQERFADLLAPYAVPDVAARLNAREMRNLRLFGYGIKGFTLSMIETAIEVSQGTIPGREIEKIIGWSKDMLQNPIELLPGVRETLQSLAGDYRLMLITKGDLFDQESKIAGSGLADLFWQIDIVSEKDEASYRRVLERHGIPPERWLMVGNSVRSDILPALGIGGSAVHIPYHTTWIHELAEIPEEAADRIREIERMDELPALIERMV